MTTIGMRTKVIMATTLLRETVSVIKMRRISM
jgi:hypothetical protein